MSVPRAASNPARSAAVCPLRRVSRTGRSRGSPAASRVSTAGLSSVEQSSTTISSQTRPLGSSAARTSSSKRARFAASSCAGTTTLSATPGVIPAFLPIGGGRSSRRRPGTPFSVRGRDRAGTRAPRGAPCPGGTGRDGRRGTSGSSAGPSGARVRGKGSQSVWVEWNIRLRAALKRARLLRSMAPRKPGKSWKKRLRRAARGSK